MEFPVVGMALRTRSIICDLFLVFGPASAFDMALSGGGARSINFNQLASDLAGITYDYGGRLPPFFTLLIRAIGVLEVCPPQKKTTVWVPAAQQEPAGHCLDISLLGPTARTLIHSQG